MTIGVRRKGLQADSNEWRDESNINVNLQPREACRARRLKCLSLDIEILHGVGQGCIGIDVGSDSFHALAQAMMEADPIIAVKAFDAAIATGKRTSTYDEDGNVNDWEPLPHEKARR